MQSKTDGGFDESVQKRHNILIAKHEKVYGRVQRLHDKFKQITAENFSVFENAFELLIRYEQSFEEVISETISHNAELDKNSEFYIEINNVIASFDDLLFETRKPYLFYSKSQCPSISSESQRPVQKLWLDTTTTSLPKIALECFKGDIGQWNEFISLYDSMVHNNEGLSKEAKFRYLKSFLKSEAAAVISQYTLSEDCYDVAYKSLSDRYNNKRLLADHYADSLLSFAKLSKSSYNNLQHFLNVHTTAINCLRKLKIADLGDYLCMILALNNLDNETRDRFERTQKSGTIPSWDSLIAFLTERVRQMELNPGSYRDGPRKSKVSFLSREKIGEGRIVSDSFERIAVGRECELCKESHGLVQCPQYLTLPVDKRYEVFKTFRLCFRCGGKHSRKSCYSKRKCSKCGFKSHHTTLHSQGKLPQVATNVKEGTEKSESEPQKESANVNNQFVKNPSVSLSCHYDGVENSPKTLLGTFRALISDIEGQKHVIRGVLDLCSEISAISSNLVQKLGLKISKPLCSDIIGFGQGHTKPIGVAQISLSNTSSPNDNVEFSASVVTSISGNIPSEANMYFPTEFNSLKLADPTYWLPSRVDVLLGAHAVGDVLTPTGHTVVSNGILTLSTLFGHILIGSTPLPSKANCKLTMFTAKGADLDETLRKFWETEEVLKSIPENPEYKIVENHFQDTLQRDKTGQYVVSLPFKVYPPPLKSNRAQVYKSFLSLELKLQKNPAQLLEYHAFMSDYLEMGHMEIAQAPSSYVIPHHCVLKESSSSTKLRVVFNGSSNDVDGNSLNTFLLPGPKLQNALPNILIMFRTFKVAFCCDIRKMFRMIGLNERDRVYQHIFYRPSLESKVQEYELKTVTYGLVSSPYQSQAVIRQLVRDEGLSFPLASKVLSSSIYVDDILYGGDSLTEVSDIRDELLVILKKGNLELRKWYSNDKTWLHTIPTEHQEVPMSFDQESQFIKILGLSWLPESDCFRFRVVPFAGSITKRTILSYISRIYDPLGFLAPLVFYMKWMLQKLWLAKVDWDESLPSSSMKEWESLVSEMPIVATILIPRHIDISRKDLSLYAFCDASEKGFSAVIYLYNNVGNSMFLLASKTKLAPLKPCLTIPRLELCGALLVSRLFRSTEHRFSNLPVNSVRFFTDSKTVLSWLRTPPHRLKTFVSHRIVEIHELTSSHRWSHVRSENNPADCASRGLSPSSLATHKLWFHGPVKDMLDLSDQNSENLILDDELPEMRSVVVSLAVQMPAVALFKYIETFSSLSRLKRIFAYVLRFISLKVKFNKMNPTRNQGPLTVDELNNGLMLAVKLTQNHYFQEEISESN